MTKALCDLRFRVLKSIYLCLVLLLFAGSSYAKVQCLKGQSEVTATAKIPEFLQGVWGPQEAKFRGQYIAEGYAIYLGNSGLGAAIDPYVGSRITIDFNRKGNIFSYETIKESGEEPFKVTGIYDAETCTLNLKSNGKEMVLIRHFATIQNELKNGLKIN